MTNARGGWDAIRRRWPGRWIAFRCVCAYLLECCFAFVQSLRIINKPSQQEESGIYLSGIDKKKKCSFLWD